MTQVSSLSTDRVDVQHIDSGIYLEVLPQLLDSSILSCQVLARLSSVKLWKKMVSRIPDFIFTGNRNMCSFKSGEPFILAGLSIKLKNNGSHRFYSWRFAVTCFCSRNGHRNNGIGHRFIITPKIFN